MVAIERQFKLHALVAVEKGDVQRIILFLDGQPLFITVIFAVRILFGYINTYSVNNLGDCQVFHVLFEWNGSYQETRQFVLCVLAFRNYLRCHY